jgi:hypothetical protein
MKNLIDRGRDPVRTVFSDPEVGRELMRRIASPRTGWWRRLARRRVSVRRAKLGRETVISERLK